MYEGPKNTVEVYRHTDGELAGTYDFRIIAAENGDILASSRQGYEHGEVARRIGLRCVSAPYTITLDASMDTFGGNQ